MRIPAIWIVAGLCLLMPALRAQSDEDKNAALRFIGGSMAAMAYNSYISIGAIGDAYESEAYDDETVNSLMQEQVNICVKLQEQLRDFVESGFTSDSNDLEYLNRFDGILELLQDEAQALIDYVDNPAELSAEQFQSAREAAWAEIADLLGIEE